MFNLFLRMLEVTNHAPMMLYDVESMPLSIVQIFRQTSVSYLSYIEMLPKKFSSSKLSLYPQPPLLPGCRNKAKLEKSNTNMTSRYWSLLANAFPFNLLNCMCHLLESTDVVGRVLHPCPTWLSVRQCRIWVFFFFFFSWIRANSAWFTPMRLDSCRIGFDLRQTELIRPESSHIGHIGSIGQRLIRSKHIRNGQNRLKSALNLAGKAEIITSKS